MNPHAVNQFITLNADKFPAHCLPAIRARIEAMDDDQCDALAYLSLKDPLVALLLSIFTGSLGVDRFYLGDIGQGIGKLLTGGGCGIWWFIDLFFVYDAAKRKNYEQFIKCTY